MSFSSDVKEDLTLHVSKARHCQMAELFSLVELSGRILDQALVVSGESDYAPRKAQLLLESLYHTSVPVETGENKKYELRLTEAGLLKRIRKDFSGDVLARSCCQKAYIRGAFLACGSINDPIKNYHIEIQNDQREALDRLQTFLTDYEVESRILERKRKNRSTYVLYIKDSEQIASTLSVMKAHRALMELENVRIVKDMRNRVNREVNCETANLNKTVNAAVRQMADIEYLIKKGELSHLSPELQEMATVRLEYPNIPLKDLGTMVDPSVSKSGVYHRLGRLSSIAEELRKNENKGDSQ